MKKSAWTDLDQKYFEKKIVKVSDVEIEKSAWTDLDQRHLEKKSSMFRLVSLDAGFVDQNLASTRWVFCQNF